MSKAEKKILKEVKEVKKEEAKKNKMLPANASSTGRQKEKVIKRPASAVGSVKNYGTPYNALNSQVLKFMPSQTQAALMAWAHTVTNPRGENPHPVPLMAAPGASASVPQMFKCTLYGTAQANAAGCVFIWANGDGWYPLRPGAGGVDVPTPGNKYLSLSGVLAGAQGFPVGCTGGGYVGDGTVGPSQFPSASYNMVTGSYAIFGVGLPSDFVPNATGDTRYTNVAVELRARPVQAALYASGELAAFNYRRAPTEATTFNGKSLGDVLAITQSVMSRERVAAPNWPGNKWLTTVGVPNTATCFGQWLPFGSVVGSAQSVGYPAAAIMGTGLPANAPIEFEATYVYAVYGTKTYTTSGNAGVDMLQVDGSRAAPVVANGFTQIGPRVAGDRPDARGVGAVVRAEQQDGRMPVGKSVIEGIKTGKEVFEAVTGTDIGEEIVSVIGDIAAMLL